MKWKRSYYTLRDCTEALSDVCASPLLTNHSLLACNTRYHCPLSHVSNGAAFPLSHSIHHKQPHTPHLPQNRSLPINRLIHHPLHQVRFTLTPLHGIQQPLPVATTGPCASTGLKVHSLSTSTNLVILYRALVRDNSPPLPNPRLEDGKFCIRRSDSP